MILSSDPNYEYKSLIRSRVKLYIIHPLAIIFITAIYILVISEQKQQDIAFYSILYGLIIIKGILVWIKAYKSRKQLTL